MDELLKKYQSMLKLNDWEVTIIEDPSIDDTASNYLIYNDYKCTIKIKSTLSPEEKEKALIHELLHMIFRDAYDLFDENVENKAIKTYCLRQHERAIEKTAKILYSIIKV